VGRLPPRFGCSHVSVKTIAAGGAAVGAVAVDAAATITADSAAAELTLLL